MNMMEVAIFNDTPYTFHIKNGTKNLMATSKDWIGQIYPMNQDGCKFTFKFFAHTHVDLDLFLYNLDTNKERLALIILHGDNVDAKEIRIYETRSDKFKCYISIKEGSSEQLPRPHPTKQEELEYDAFENEKENASKWMKIVEEFCRDLENLLEQVNLHPAQCKHLVQTCSTRTQEIKTVYSSVSKERQVWSLFESRKLRLFISSLETVLNSLVSAQNLLQECSAKRWERAALVLSMPPSKLEKYPGSKFFLLGRELGWSLDIVQYALQLPSAESEESDESLVKNQGLSFPRKWLCNYFPKVFQSFPTDPNFKWSENRHRYVFQSRHGIEVAIDEAESLQDDYDRQTSDRKHLLHYLENNSIVLNMGSSVNATKFATIVKSRCQDDSGSKSEPLILKCFEIDFSDLEISIFPLAEGASKKIYQGWWLELLVAIAEYTSQRTEETEPIVRKETGFLVNLHHPNIVEFFGYASKERIIMPSEDVRKAGSTSDKDARKWVTDYLVMEHMEEDLHSLIQRRSRGSGHSRESSGPFSWSVTIDILLQIVEAMIHAHKHHIMHRDLKTHNCLVSAKHQADSDAQSSDVYYTVKLIDFGESKHWDSDMDMHTRKTGTVRYMAPEVYDGLRYTWSADVYSFGMVCYEVIAGKPPYKEQKLGRDIMTMVHQLKRPDIPITCPQSFKDLMEKCWASKYLKRPTFEAIRQELWNIRLSIAIQI